MGAPVTAGVEKADLVAVSGNPLEQLDTLKGIAFVMKEGRVFKAVPAAK